MCLGRLTVREGFVCGTSLDERSRNVQHREQHVWRSRGAGALRATVKGQGHLRSERQGSHTALALAVSMQSCGWCVEPVGQWGLWITCDLTARMIVMAGSRRVCGHRMAGPAAGGSGQVAARDKTKMKEVAVMCSRRTSRKSI